MIRRSFWAPGTPKLFYDVLESELENPKEIASPANLTFLLNDPVINGKKTLLQPKSSVARGDQIRLYETSQDCVVCPVDAKVHVVDSYVDHQGRKGSIVTVAASQETMEPVSLDMEETLAYAQNFLQKIPGGLPFDRFGREDAPVHTIVVNCADEDLLSTTNQFIARACTDEIIQGIRIMKKTTGVENIYIAVPETLASSLDFADFQVLKISRRYPCALPAMIMKDHLGQTVPAGMRPEDLGFCFIRPEGLVSLAKVHARKECDFTKIVKIVGKNGESFRVRAKIGTPVANIFNALDIEVNEQDRVIIGGPMQGFATYTIFHPVTCDMNTVVVQAQDQIPRMEDTTCFNCGNCIRVCPAKVPTNLLIRHLQADLYEEAAEKFDLESCLECGLCTYVCPARIPLLQFSRLGKMELKRLRALQAAEEEETENNQAQAQEEQVA